MFSLLLSVAMLVTFDCRTITIRNDCRYTVWFETYASYDDEVKVWNSNISEIPDDLDSPKKLVHKHTNRYFSLAPGGHMSYDVPKFQYSEDIYPVIGCDSDGANCASLSTDDVPMSRVSLQLSEIMDNLFENRHELDILSELQYGQYRDEYEYDMEYEILNNQYHDHYEVDIRHGYHIAMRVTPFGVGICHSLICNVTLDECPTDERYDIGDLRVVVDNRTIACQSPHRKQQMDMISRSLPEEIADVCPPKDLPQLKYVEMVNRMCPGSSSLYEDQKDAFKVKRRCLTGSSFDVVTCDNRPIISFPPFPPGHMIALGKPLVCHRPINFFKF